MVVAEQNEEGRHSRPPLTGVVFTMTVVQTPVDRTPIYNSDQMNLTGNTPSRDSPLLCVNS